MSGSSEQAIVLDEVTLRYGSTVALSEVSLTVPTGAVIGLLGHNGAGKTTLLRTLVGLLSPKKGSVRVLGQDHPSRWLRMMGHMPEEPLFFGWLHSKPRAISVCA